MRPVVLAILAGLCALPVALGKTKIMQTNDDGWAEANIRALTNLLNAEKDIDTFLCSPAENESGTGSSDAPPTVVTDGCEFDTCPAGSSPEGFNASDPRLNYVNSFPVTSVKFALANLTTKLIGGRPDLIVSGPNVGGNLGPGVLNSGTVGAACEAAKEGIPSIAVSGNNTNQVSFTLLSTDPTGPDATSARFNAELSIKIAKTLLDSFIKPVLLPNITLNVNLPNVTSCHSADDVKFILTRINPPAEPDTKDTFTCGSFHLPLETPLMATGECFSSISVMNATTKADVDALTQTFVLHKLLPILSCS